MNRRAFTALAACGFGLPVLPRSSRASEPEVAPGATGKPGTGTLSTAEIVSRVEARYEKVGTFEARFKQQSYLLPAERGTTGRVIFEKPSKMSWRYASTGNRIVSDGVRIQVYERESQRLYDQELAASLYPLALSFLSAPGKLSSNFRLAEQQPITPKGVHVLVAEPLRASAACASLTLDVDVRSYEVRRVRIRDAQGNRHGFAFVAPQLNTRVPRGEFTFSPPPHTQIIRL